MSQQFLRGKEIKQISIELFKIYEREFFTKKDKVAIVETEKYKILLIGDVPLFFSCQGTWVPTLKLLHRDNFLPEVVVDKGAVKFVSSGADIMRPGVVSFSNFNKGDFVAVKDETFKKILCIGKALYSSEETENVKSGKIILNLHYVGDLIWQL